MKVGFIGGGSWGASLANLLTDNGYEVLVYDVNKDTVALINEAHKHPFFDATLNVEVKATTSIEEVLSFSNTLVLSVPTKFMRSVLEQVNNLSTEPKFFINVSKGIEPETSKTISQIAEEVMDSNKLKGFVTLSGPSHAEEVIERKLTVLVSASKNEADAVYVQNLFANHKYIRVYSSTDIIGVEVAGSVKNAIALVSGICTGYGLGENARAALISRGILEIIRITEVLGGKKETAYGLAGIGDLIVTASSMNSRNFQAGLKIGQGQNVYDVVRNSKMVVEGARVLESAQRIAKDHNLYLPIIDTAYRVIYEDLNLDLAIEIILSAKLKSE